MKLILRITLILLAVALVIGGTYAWVQTGGLQSLSVGRGGPGFEGNRPFEGQQFEGNRPPRGDDFDGGRERGGFFNLLGAGALIKNLVIMVGLVLAGVGITLFIQFVRRRWPRSAAPPKAEA